MPHCEMLIDGHFFGGPCDQSIGKQVVRAPYDNAIVGTAAEGGLTDLKTCVDAAHEAFQTWRHSSRLQRQTLLNKVAQLVREREGELVDLLTREVGKPVVWSRGEVARLALTFEVAAHELATFGLESLPVDYDPRGADYRCTVERFPIGVIFAIVPYNWPFNLAAHKIAPALATGNTVVLKPSHQAPLSTLALARIIHEAGCPPGVLNAWNGPSALAQKVLEEDSRIKMLSFTGSPPVGWMLKEKLPDRRVTLELGGNATAIVCPNADQKWATNRIVAGAYGYAGQICIAIQHTLVHRDIYEAVKTQLIEKTNACPHGDPEKEETVCGPMIDEKAADKVQSWQEEAVQAGAKVIAGGGRTGNIIHPTLLENVPDTVMLANQEVFGPLLTLAPYDTLDEAITRVNRSEYGIQTGIFTTHIPTAEKAYREIETGGLIVNDYPTLRFDNMPYSGVKKSGFGREGVRYTMEDMTDPKTLVVKVR